MLTVYTKKDCPFCQKLKQILNSQEVKFQEIDVTFQPDELKKLQGKTGMITVPQVFKDDQFIGGLSDIEELQNQGKLQFE